MSITDIPLHYVDVIVGHVVVGLAKVLEEDTEKTGRGDQDKGLLVEDVNLLGDEESGETSTEGEETGLGNERVARERVNDAGSLLLGVN